MSSAQIVFGVAINFIAAGSTIILGQAWFRQGARRRSLKTRDSIVVPSAEGVRGVPVLGPVYPELIYGPFAAGLCRVPDGATTWLVLFSTRFGLGLRPVGENPAAVDTTGISVTWLRYRAASSPAF